MQSRLIVEQLKRELKLRLITYKDLATRISLSEPAVKRLFAARNFSLKRLDEICNAIGIDIAQLVATAARSNDKAASFTDHVEEELANDANLLLALYYAMQGTNARDMQTQLAVDARAVFRLLRALEKLGLIELHKDSRIKCLAQPSTRWRPNGPLAKKYAQRLRAEFFNSTFAGPGEFQDFLTGRLSSSSVEHLRKKLGAVFSEFSETSLLDAQQASDTSSSDEIFWFYAGMRRWAPIPVVKGNT